MEITKSGIIRRMDDLGRIVIPKELRTQLRVREGDAFELGIIEMNGTKTFTATPYSPMRDRLGDHAPALVRKMGALLNDSCEVVIADNLHIFGSRGFTSNTPCVSAMYDVVKNTRRNHVDERDIPDDENSFFAVPLFEDNEVIACLAVIGPKAAVLESKKAVSSFAEIIAVFFT